MQLQVAKKFDDRLSWFARVHGRDRQDTKKLQQHTPHFTYIIKLTQNQKLTAN